MVSDKEKKKITRELLDLLKDFPKQSAEQQKFVIDKISSDNRVLKEMTNIMLKDCIKKKLMSENDATFFEKTKDSFPFLLLLYTEESISDKDTMLFVTENKVLLENKTFLNSISAKIRVENIEDAFNTVLDYKKDDDIDYKSYIG